MDVKYGQTHASSIHLRIFKAVYNNPGGYRPGAHQKFGDKAHRLGRVSGLEGTNERTLSKEHAHVYEIWSEEILD